MKKIIFFAALAFAGSASFAQNNMGILTHTPDASAVLEVAGTAQGVLLPRMTQIQMNAIANPAQGLMLICTDCSPAGLKLYNGTGYQSVAIVPPSTFAASTLSCTGTLSGNYFTGTATTAANIKGVSVTVVTAGPFNITTNTVNGISFGGAGSPTSTGSQGITLTATGTPTAVGTFSYTATAGSQTCTFSVTVTVPPPPATFACGSSTSAFTPAGNLVSSTSYSGTYTLPYTAGNGTTYGAATLTQSGLTLTRTAGTYTTATAGGNVVYTLSGIYTGTAPSQTFNIAEGCAVGVPATYVSTFAGTGVQGSADGPYNTATFYSPYGIAADGNGNVFVADKSNHTIRKITPAGVVSTLAGTAGLSGSADGTGAAARFDLPNGIAVDGNGNVYVADYNNHTIRKITSAGVVTTLAGTAGVTGTTNGTGPAAKFYFPTGVSLDGSDNLYVADYGNHSIRKITLSNSAVTTFAGSPGVAGSSNGTGTAVRFNLPNSIAIDGNVNMYVSDQNNNAIRKIVIATGAVTTLAGSPGSFGSTDGIGNAAMFSYPTGLVVDGNGSMYVADYFNENIRKVALANGAVTTIAGTSGSPGSTDGTGTTARFNHPTGIAIDGNGNLYVADQNNNSIRKIAH